MTIDRIKTTTPKLLLLLLFLLFLLWVGMLLTSPIHAIALIAYSTFGITAVSIIPIILIINYKSINKEEEDGKASV